MARVGYAGAVALLIFLFGSRGLQNAVAEGETRTITMHHLHTGEDITITYKREGRYDEAALAKLDWFLRDWRRGQSTHMDPRLIDLVWEVQRESGTNEPIQVVCGYRSPETNAMLRRSSEGVARFSQHILGRAMDFYIAGIPLEQLREIGLRLQRGGVGFYPESGSPFVHMDVAGIRMWPRMTREQLVRVFPDGRTVQIPTDGKPLPGYAQALAEVTKRGAVPSENSLEAARSAGISVDTLLASNERPARSSTNPIARLLGLGKDSGMSKEDDDEDAVAAAPSAAAAKPVVLAGLAPKNESKPTTGVTAKIARAIDKLKLVHVAKLLPTIAPKPTASPTAPSRPVTLAALTPNEIILARGYWAGPPDSAPVNPLTEVAYRRAAASGAGPDSTGSIGPFANSSDDRAGPELAMAYAEQPAGGSPSGVSAASVGIAALRAAALNAREAVPAATTVAMKRTASEVASAVVSASSSSVTVIKSGALFANPWLRAIVLSPSVRRFLTTVALGERDFRSLAELMVKPKSSVVMTFAAEPNPGLSQDHFSGSAIVFVSTVSYSNAPTHTAALQ